MVNTVIIGAGSIAHKHAEALNRLSDVRVLGVLDPNEENAKRVAALCGARTIKSLGEILDSVQTVHLFTPPSKRVEYAEPAMWAGKHIFCEKPLASGLDDALTLAALAKETGVFFMTAFNMRFRPGYRRLQEDVLSGRLGEILSVWCHRIGPGSGFSASLGDSWRTDPSLACGMTIESLAHDIDMIRGLGLEIENVAGWAKGSKPELPSFDNNAQLLMRLNNGGSAVINASWASHLSMCSRGVVGSKGTAAILGNSFFDFMTYRLFTHNMEHEQVTQLNDPFDAESYYAENKHFVQCVQDGSQPIINEDNGVETIRVSLAALKSAAECRFVHPGEAL